MKRLNPDTNIEFRRGDKRDDGYIFIRYKTDILNSNGFFREDWAKPNRFEYGIKRKNPTTDTIFKRGDKNQIGGKVFWGYDTKSKDKNGYCYENWLDLHNFYIRQKQSNQHSNIQKIKNKEEAKNKNIPKRVLSDKV